MTIERLKSGEKSKYLIDGLRDIPKDLKSNWVTIFMMDNPRKTLADVVKMPRFRAESSHYHYIIVERANGSKKGLLFHDGACVYTAWSQLENVELDDGADDDNA